MFSYSFTCENRSLARLTILGILRMTAITRTGTRYEQRIFFCPFVTTRALENSLHFLDLSDHLEALSYLICEGGTDGDVSLDGDRDGEEDAGRDGDVRDTVRVGDEGVQHTDQIGVEVLERHCHGAEDDEDVRRTKEHHQIIENIPHRSTHIKND